MREALRTMPSFGRTHAGTLITSINPRMVRSRQGVSCGPAYQRECVESWIACGFDVVSLNSESEAELVKNFGLPVRVKEVAYSGPPLIRDLVDIELTSATDFMGIVNSDCILYPLDGAIARIREATETGIVLVERVNSDPANADFLGDPLGGFDGFFLAKPSNEILTDLKLGHPFRIGDLWWDFWFPCLYLANGMTVRQCMLPLLSHLEHERGRSPDVYLRNGEFFRRELLRLRKAHAESPLAKLLAALPSLETVTLRELAYGIHSQLWQSPGSVPLACGPRHLQELERYVYFLRNHHRWSTQQKDREQGVFSTIRKINHRRLDRRRTERAKKLVDGSQG